MNIKDKSKKGTLTDFIDAAGVAQKLKISKQTVYRWVKKKLIPSYKFGGTLFFKESEIVELINKSKQ